MLTVTADTNILVSGLNFRRGNPYEFLEMARAGTIRLSVSNAILEEMAQVLRRKFDGPEEDITQARDQILRFSHQASPTGMLDVVKDDPDEARVLWQHPDTERRRFYRIGARCPLISGWSHDVKCKLLGVDRR